MLWIKSGPLFLSNYISNSLCVKMSLKRGFGSCYLSTCYWSIPLLRCYHPIHFIAALTEEHFALSAKLLCLPCDDGWLASAIYPIPVWVGPTRNSVRIVLYAVGIRPYIVLASWCCWRVTGDQGSKINSCKINGEHVIKSTKRRIAKKEKRKKDKKEDHFL